MASTYILFLAVLFAASTLSEAKKAKEKPKWAKKDLRDYR
jgi:hypothetical protein